jgi:hypothetical protein
MAHAMTQIIRRSVAVSIRLCEYFLNIYKLLIYIKKPPHKEGEGGRRIAGKGNADRSSLELLGIHNK